MTLGETDVLTVCRGIVSVRTLHEDGSGVWLGLCGDCDLVIGHPEADGCLVVEALTDVEATLETWDQAVQSDGFVFRLRTRIRAMERWAGAQARPLVRERLVSLLELLADRFGEHDGATTAIPATLTHRELAAAVGATRPTVSRTLASLRRQRKLTGGNRREPLRLLRSGPVGRRS